MFRRWTSIGRGVVILLATSMAAGLVFSLGIAVVCAIWSPADSATAVMPASEDEPEVARLLVRHGSFDQYMVHTKEGIGWRYVRVMGFVDQYAGGPHNRNRVDRYEAGWPRPALAGEKREIRGEPVEWGLARVPDWPHAPRAAERALPWYPAWGGLAVNTLIFGGAMFLVHFGWWGGRRMQRMWQGRCMHCGYLLTGHSAGDAQPRCPECGVVDNAAG